LFWETDVATGALLWWGAAGVLIVLELLTGTFYLLMISLGVIAGGLAYWAGAAPHVQFGCAAAVAAVAVIVLRRSRFGGRRARVDAATSPDVNLDIGATLTVAEWHDGRARTNYRGAQWDVELAPGEPEDARLYEITALRGNRLIVAAHRQPAHA
jgi:membrane protein implicated in regulation of membrane protease activity